MLSPEQARSLCDYDIWANHRILEACEALSAEEFIRDLRSSFRSVQGTLLHILGGEWFWLERWRGRSPGAVDLHRQGFFPPPLLEQWFGGSLGTLPSPERYPDLASVRRRWEEIEGDFQRFVAGPLTEGPDRVLHYRTTEGHPNSQPFWQMLQHVINHGTQYRGQVATLLRQLGKTPIATDLILYYRENQAKPPAPIDPETIRLLYDYNAWANHRLLDSCAGLGAEQFTRDLGSSFRSVRDTLAHILWADWLWLERWHGRSPGPMPPAEQFPDLRSLRARWAEVERDLLQFVAGLAPPDLAQLSAYRTTKGIAVSNPLWQSLQHLANHGTYHRGQVAAMLRQSGVKPNFTDLIYFYRERAGQALD